MEKIAVIFGNHVVYWRPLLLAAGAATAILIFLGLYLMEPHRSVSAAVSVALAVILGLVGARLVHWYCRFGEYGGIWDALTRFSGGFVLLGVFFGCTVAALIGYHRREPLCLASELDCMSIAGCAGIAVGRLAYFYSSADRGPLASSARGLPWVYPVTNAVSGAVEYRFATFLIQAICAGVLFILLLTVYLAFTRRKKLRPGGVFELFVLFYSSTQAVLDSTRYDSLAFRSNGFVSVVQVFSAIGMAVVIACSAIRLMRRPQKSRVWPLLLCALVIAGLGVAGYMEYYVQRHRSQAVMAYSIMGGALAAVDLAGAVMVASAPRALDVPGDAPAKRRFAPRWLRKGAITVLLVLCSVGSCAVLASTFSVHVNGQALSQPDQADSSALTSIDLSGKRVSLEDLEVTLDQLPNLQTANLLGTNLSDQEMMELVQRYPNCHFLWEAEVAGERFRTDITDMDLSNREITSLDALEEMLPCFPLLQRVDMSHCGIDDETMEALNQRHEGIQFVWTVVIHGYDFPTDSLYFFPWKLNGGEYMDVTDEDMKALRYCHDIQCVDIGHMWYVSNCEWVRYMPELKYLIIGETGITDITPLSSCKNLVYLEMFTIQVTDLTPLQGCTALEDLNLGRVYDADPEPLTKMPWLKNIWWANVDGTYGRGASNAKQVLTEALPNTRLEFNLAHPTTGGWRQLPNYYAQRDLMGMFYMN